MYGTKQKKKFHFTCKVVDAQEIFLGDRLTGELISFLDLIGEDISVVDNDGEQRSLLDNTMSSVDFCFNILGLISKAGYLSSGVSDSELDEELFLRADFEGVLLDPFSLGVLAAVSTLSTEKILEVRNLGGFFLGGGAMESNF